MTHSCPWVVIWDGFPKKKKKKKKCSSSSGRAKRLGNSFKSWRKGILRNLKCGSLQPVISNANILLTPMIILNLFMVDHPSYKKISPYWCKWVANCRLPKNVGFVKRKKPWLKRLVWIYLKMFSIKKERKEKKNRFHMHKKNQRNYRSNWAIFSTFICFILCFWTTQAFYMRCLISAMHLHTQCFI